VINRNLKGVQKAAVREKTTCRSSKYLSLESDQRMQSTLPVSSLMIKWRTKVSIPPAVKTKKGLFVVSTLAIFLPVCRSLLLFLPMNEFASLTLTTMPATTCLLQRVGVKKGVIHERMSKVQKLFLCLPHSPPEESACQCRSSRHRLNPCRGLFDSHPW